jgi:hypothetical protein
VDVDDEADVAERLGTQAVDLPDVERLEHRIDGDPVARPRATSEVDGLAVHEDKVDLCVGDAGRLDDVLDRLVRPEGSAHDRTSQLRWHEVVQLGIDADLDVAVVDV